MRELDRNIYGRTDLKSMNITASDHYDGSHGACQTMISYSNTATYQPWGYKVPGAFLVKSYAQTSAVDPNVVGLGYGYQNWESTGEIHNIFLIDGMGHGIFGHDDDLSYIQGDVFTIKQSLGFYFSDDVTPRTISGHTAAGLLNIAADNNYSDGSNMTLYGSTNSGKILFSSYGTTGLSMAFQNYDGSSLHQNVNITNNGQMTVGHDLSTSSISGGDVLTVQTSLGFYNSDDATWRTIKGHTASAGLGLFAKSAESDGACIGIYGGSHSVYPGEILFSSLGSTGNSMVFNNYSGGLHTNVIMTNAGQMVVGHDVAASVIASGDVLTVNSQIGMYSSTGGEVNINGNSTASALALHANTGSENGATIEMYGPSASGKQGKIMYIADGVATPTGIGHEFCDWNGSSWVSRMRIYNNGAVAIGDPAMSTPGVGTNYMMYVQYGVLTEHCRVASHTTGAWADFVFNKDYKLAPLNKVEAYLKENRHLPGIPSADDVEKNGIDVESMDSKLLQKIEELTLYVIQQNKRIEELEKENAKKK